ncbi:hypothetical protein [Hyalangium sp.]|uniref:hypothetical protein n=1 Tax=Hyalangium sp. TaxID=2028555 RepID=UPI002D59FF5B|nr:hypothetical protein [Hyalangium sp.]HYI02900.1 hypothetical protein [Hyalangium sp.]
MGQRFDPLLAAAFSTFGKLSLSPSHSLLIRCDDEVSGLVIENEDSRKYWPERFHRPVVFGRDMRYCYATLPELVGDEGFQPVIWIDPYEEIYALPIASDVNRFFETVSRYLDVVADEPDFKVRQVPSVAFPWEVPELLAADAALGVMIRAGKFDPWMYSGDEASARAIRDWVGKIQSARRNP